MRQETLFIVTIWLKKLSADCNLGRVVDVGTHAFVPLVALAELVEEHAVLLASSLGLDDGVDAPVLVGSDGLPSHRVPASNQNSGLVLDVLLTVEVKFPGNDFGRRRFFGDFGFWSFGEFCFESVQFSAVIGHLVTYTLDRKNI